MQIVYYKLGPDKEILPASEQEGLALIGDPKARQVACTDLFLGVYVSTIFLVLDHGWLARIANDDFSSRPILFETLICGGKFSGRMWRYGSWDEAQEGHKRAVRLAYSEFTGEEIEDPDSTETPG